MAKKTNPTGTKVDRTLPFKLTDAEKARKSEIAAKIHKQLEEAQDAKRADMVKHNGKIKELSGKVSTELRMINDGIERRAVKAIMIKNFEKDQIEYYYEGELMETVTMKPSDRQEELPIKDPKPRKGAKPDKWRSMAPNYKPKKDPEDERDEEIADVHRSETSRKGASSAVDPR